MNSLAILLIVALPAERYSVLDIEQRQALPDELPQGRLVVRRDDLPPVACSALLARILVPLQDSLSPAVILRLHPDAPDGFSRAGPAPVRLEDPDAVLVQPDVRGRHGSWRSI